jgi:hypothetical protein
VKAKILFWALIAVAFNIPAAAAQGYGLGVHSCAEFAKLYAGNPKVAEDLYFTWAQGFISGLNLSSTAGTGVYRDVEGTYAQMAAQKIRIRSYCDEHPLSQYLSAILDLYNSLPLKKTNSN